MAGIVNWLFVDLNSYFASVEQELVPDLRGQPIVIVPIEAENACCIAASYQAKAYGISSGHPAFACLPRSCWYDIGSIQNLKGIDCTL
jgi:nucleotidyltransferase/DNA polymerase involved in DNA repair